LQADILPEVQRAENEQIWSLLHELRYIFKHALLRDAAYEMQLQTRLRALHCLAAEGLERLHAADLAPYYGALAYHYATAYRQGADEVRGQASTYLHQAGAQAARNYANAAALDYYARLLPLLTEPLEQIEIRLQRGAVWQLTGQWAEAEAEYRAGLALAEQIQDAPGRARTRQMLGTLARLRGNNEEALAQLKQARAEWTVLDDQPMLSRTVTEIGYVYLRKGDFAEARRHSEKGLMLARELGDKHGIALALNTLGIVAYHQVEYVAARALYEEGLTLRRELGDKRDISVSLNNLGVNARAQGDYATARALHGESLVFKREMGDKRGIAMSLSNLGLLAYAQGDYVAARAFQEESLAIFHEIGDKQGIAWLVLGLVDLAEHKAEAREHLLNSLRLQQETGEQHAQTSSLIGIAGWALQVGQPRFAAQLLGVVISALNALKAKVDSDLENLYTQTLAQAREQLGEEAFNAAWEEGSRWSLEEAVQLVFNVTG